MISLYSDWKPGRQFVTTTIVRENGMERYTLAVIIRELADRESCARSARRVNDIIRKELFGE